jgi:myo-inositol-1(or 4)-monophosphatase
MTKRDQKHILSFCRQTAERAGAILLRGFNKSLRVAYKGRINPVTQFDLKSEKYITGEIKKRFPYHAILTEEGTATGESSDCRWVIDPLDGTVNFAHGFPVYCVSIAFEYKGEILAGAVFDPERHELFSASRAQGAFLNGKRIQVSSERRLDRALLATGFSYNIKTARRNNLGLFSRMVKQAQGVRRPGSAAIDLCWLASGRIDGFWELDLHPWDTAAALVIVEEAGGRVTRMDDREYSIFDKDILATNSVLHRQMKEVLNGG